jgi:hypothetical protein
MRINDRRGGEGKGETDREKFALEVGRKHGRQTVAHTLHSTQHFVIKLDFACTRGEENESEEAEEECVRVCTSFDISEVLNDGLHTSVQRSDSFCQRRIVRSDWRRKRKKKRRREQQAASRKKNEYSDQSNRLRYHQRRLLHSARQ